MYHVPHPLHLGPAQWFLLHKGPKVEVKCKVQLLQRLGKSCIWSKALHKSKIRFWVLMVFLWAWPNCSHFSVSYNNHNVAKKYLKSSQKVLEFRGCHVQSWGVLLSFLGESLIWRPWLMAGPNHISNVASTARVPAALRKFSGHGTA